MVDVFVDSLNESQCSNAVGLSKSMCKQINDKWYINSPQSMTAYICIGLCSRFDFRYTATQAY